ncbi:hypothetical protein FSP39_021002 [Pinctada imbricata]|uniref:N-acetylneuraminate lyase n=1 Tax=Pinctada imbricata TaxID=66713 RepID=A0AA88XNI3_PINIB|nr:hypothetical protein FSP39_021002 [Pinctada imbricata]
MKGILVYGINQIHFRELDLDKIEPYCEFLLNNDIKAIYVNGGTGEGPSLTLKERKDIVEKWIEVSKGRLKIVVHIGGTTPKESKELTIQAAKAGADAIATLPTLFFKPQNIVNMEDFMKEAKKEIPNLVGIKFSSKDLIDMIGVRYAGKFNILYGYDQQLMGGLIMGAHGSIGTLHNFMPGVYHRLIGHFEKGDNESARNEQIKGQQLCRLVEKYGKILGGNLAAFKIFMPLVGLDLGPCREPMRTLTESESKEFVKDINNLCFLEWKPAKF